MKMGEMKEGIDGARKDEVGWGTEGRTEFKLRKWEEKYREEEVKGKSFSSTWEDETSPRKKS